MNEFTSVERANELRGTLFLNSIPACEFRNGFTNENKIVLHLPTYKCIVAKVST